MNAKQQEFQELARQRVVHCMSGEHYDIYAGRGRCPTTQTLGKWGNRYTHRPSRVPGVVVVSTVEEAVAFHKREIWERLHDGTLSKELLASLDGKVWGCWCHRPPCHAYTLAAAAAWAARTL